MTDLKCETIYIQMVDNFARENEIQELKPPTIDGLEEQKRKGWTDF